MEFLENFFANIGIPKWIYISICVSLFFIGLWIKSLNTIHKLIYKKDNKVNVGEEKKEEVKSKKISNKKKSDRNKEENNKSIEKEPSRKNELTEKLYISVPFALILFIICFILPWWRIRNENKLSPTPKGKIGIWVARFKNDKENICNSGIITHLNNFIIDENLNETFEVRDLQKENSGDDIKIQFLKAEKIGKEVNATLIVFGNTLNTGENTNSTCYWYIAFPKNKDGLFLPNKSCKGKFKLDELTQISGTPVDIKNIGLICKIIQGIAFCRNTDYDKAKEIFMKIFSNEKILKEKNTSIPWDIAYLYLGICYMQTSKDEEAIKYYNKALNVDPNNGVVWNNKGMALYNQGKYDEAIKCLDKSLEISPNYTLTWYNKGTALNKQGKYDEAIKYSDKVLTVNPNDDGAWNNKGVALYNQGKYDEATKCYDKSLKINPNSDTVWNNKGMALYNQGKYNEAIQCYDEALKINSNNDAIWHNKGIALYNQGKYAEAIKCYDKSLKINPNNKKAKINRDILNHAH